MVDSKKSIFCSFGQNQKQMFATSIVLILFTLAFQTFPLALGFEGKTPVKALLYGGIIIFVQVAFLVLGLVLGDRFMHLLEAYRGTVIFVGFFLVGVRMIIDSFKVRRGERTYSLDTNLQLILAAVAQSINTFLAGMILVNFALDRQWLTIVLFLLTLVSTGFGLFLKPTKLPLAAASLLFAIGGLIMIFSSVYLGFIH